MPWLGPLKQAFVDALLCYREYASSPIRLWRSTLAPTHSAAQRETASIWISGRTGASYLLSIPVMFASSPRRGLA